jgi:8-oxo-dGTP pyrophosphatase MutT (NUDIX family)
MNQSDATNHPCPVPVVRAIIEDAVGKVLILQRANTAWGDNAWCLPGGKIDYGQTVAEALSREIHEETALLLKSAALLLVQDSLPSQPEGMHCLNLYFRCSVSGVLRLNNESSAFAWVSPDDMHEYSIVFRNDEALRRHFAGELDTPYPFENDAHEERSYGIR